MRGIQVEAVEGGEHAEFELDGVGFGRVEGLPGPRGWGPVREGEAVVDEVLDAVYVWVHVEGSAEGGGVGVRVLGGVGVRGGEVVGDGVGSDDAEFFEGPAREFLREGLVGGLGGFGAGVGQLHGGVEPAVFEGLGGSEDGEAGGVAGLEGGHQAELLACGEDVFDTLDFLLGVVGVCGGRGLDDGAEEWRGVAQCCADRVREGEEAVDGEEVDQAGLLAAHVVS